jgi:hypothetical protein
MKQICLNIAVFLLLGSARAGIAQSPENLRPVPQLALPSGSDVWVVEIFSSGGITGGSSRDFALSSRGRIVCDSPKDDCPRRFSRATLQSFFQDVPLAGQAVPVPSVPSLCSDCVTKTMVVRRRDPQGIEQTFTASWNVLTASTVPPEVMRLYKAVVSVRTRQR